MKQANSKEKAILFGPFVGELSWEFYRFAPYLIYLKKSNPNITTIVYSRPQRVDLYGQYTNIFIPLKLKNDLPEMQDKFRLNNLDHYIYKDIARIFKEKYLERFNIQEHFYPDIFDWRYKVKWQYPRNKMDYSFLPRRENFLLVNRLLVSKEKCCLYCLNASDEIEYLNDNEYLVFTPESLEKKITNLTTTSFLGILIEYIKKCSFVISDYYSTYFHLALLLGCPVLTTSLINKDELSLLNPLKTEVIKYDFLDKGIINYENYIRSQRGGIREQRRFQYSS